MYIHIHCCPPSNYDEKLENFAFDPDLYKFFSNKRLDQFSNQILIWYIKCSCLLIIKILGIIIIMKKMGSELLLK